MEEIAYDIPVHYPLPPKNVEWGEVGTLHSNTLVNLVGLDPVPTWHLPASWVIQSLKYRSQCT